MYQETDNILPSLKLPEMTITTKRNDKLNSGRWKPNEHEKFLEAIIIHGNDWKLVQKCIRSRSSTQARSHAQKFLLKLRKKLKIEPDSTNKLTKESIDKIVREIVDTSSLRNSTVIEKEKLVKLIMGFSNLLVGKVIPQANFPENPSPNNYYFNAQDPYFESNFQANFFNRNDFNENGKKVFNIEKVLRADRKGSSSFFSTEMSFHDKLQKNISGNTVFPDGNKANVQISHINNQNDLLKYLFQTPQQDPSGKNVINIISINICNKNEAEGGLLTGNQFPANLINQKDAQNTISQRKAIFNLIGASMPNSSTINNRNASHASLPKVDSASKLDNSSINEKVDLKSEGNSNIVNNKTTVSSSPNSNNFDQDFYDKSHSSANFFHQINAEEEDYDKFFEWN